MIVATAGHIDHGKTLLVKTLTGVDTDRLPEEKARGISIDIGFAYLPLAGGGLIGFVDVPGHERFVRNMLAGVCGIDFALLVVAADDGVMPQTVEHLQILDLLGIRKGIAAITKTDRVDRERVGEVEAQVRELVAGTGLEGIGLAPVSAVSGTGIDTLRQSLEDAARAHATRYREGQHFRLAIDRSFTVAGSGTVVTGTVFNGEVRPGDRLVVSPAGTPVRVRGIQIRGQSAGRAQAGDRCAINLSGIDVEAVSRGDWVLHEALHAPSRRLDVRFKLLSTEREPLRHWMPVHLHLATADVTARIAIGRGETIAPGSSARAHLVADAPVAALAGDRFILRDQSAGHTLGGGSVIDPFAPATRRASPARLAALAALERGTPEAALAGLLEIPGQPVELARFEKSFNLASERAAALYRSAGAEVLGREERVALARESAAALRAKALARLAEHHRAQPQAAGMALEALRKEISPWLAPDAFLALLREAAEGGKLKVDGATIMLSGHHAAFGSQEERMWQSVLPALAQAGLAVPPVAELAKKLGLKEAVLKDLLYRKCKTGEVMRVGEDRFYPKSTLATLAASAAELARSSPQGMFTAAQYRDATGVGRTLVIKILEFFDTLAITQRIGDARKMRKDFVPILGAAKPELASVAPPPGRPPGSAPDRNRKAPGRAAR